MQSTRMETGGVIPRISSTLSAKRAIYAKDELNSDDFESNELVLAKSPKDLKRNGHLIVGLSQKGNAGKKFVIDSRNAAREESQEFLSLTRSEDQLSYPTLPAIQGSA